MSITAALMVLHVTVGSVDIALQEPLIAPTPKSPKQPDQLILKIANKKARKIGLF